MTPASRKRYEQSKQKHDLTAYPVTVKDFGHVKPSYPPTDKANGLTRAIVQFLTWEGYRATRVNSQGQFIVEKYQGRVVNHGFRPGATRKGTADISATIRGRSVMLEVKAGNDSPKEKQIKEQARERAAGGIYEFIYDFEQFLTFYDSLILSLNRAPGIE